MSTETILVDVPEAIRDIPKWEIESLIAVGLNRDVVMNYVLWSIQCFHHHETDITETIYQCMEDDVSSGCNGELTNDNSLRLDVLIEHYVKIANELYSVLKCLLKDYEEDTYMSIQLINPYVLAVGVE